MHPLIITYTQYQTEGVRIRATGKSLGPELVETTNRLEKNITVLEKKLNCVGWVCKVCS